MKKVIIGLICTFLLLTNSAYAKKKPVKSMFEVREVQTHYYDTTDTYKVTKAVINTLQDNGFVVQNIEDELGFIRAKKEDRLKRTNKARITLYSTDFAVNTACLAISFGMNPFAILGMAQDTVRISNEVAPHTVIFDSNINIETVGKRTKVRLSIIEKELENADGYTTVKASPRKVVRHYHPEIYQEFFNQVDKNLFLENTL
ncbi:hypothetical protein IJ732_02490 [bacterium]|nr:hypothetical protein [bacterium]